MRKTIQIFIAVAVLAVAAIADVPRPQNSPKAAKKNPSIETHLSIRLDRQATEATLILSKDQLKQLRAELDGLESGAGDKSAGAGISQVQTIVSGLFISLAMVFAGVWFVRSGKLSTNSGKAAAASFVLLSGGALATMVYANAGPPAEARSITGKMFSQALHVYKFGGGAIKLEISADASNPVLIVPDPQDPKKADE